MEANYIPLQSKDQILDEVNGQPCGFSAQDFVTNNSSYSFMNGDENATPPTLPDLCKSAAFTVKIDGVLISSTTEGIVDGRPPIRI